MSYIYTRDFKSVKSQRYSPPPGYDGNTFAASNLKNDEYQQSDYQRDKAIGPTVRYVAKNNPQDTHPQDVQVDDADITKSDSSDSFEKDECIDDKRFKNDILSAKADGEGGENEEKNDTVELREKNQSRINFRENDAIFKLIESLHGKFGREELIILLVMFLVSSDGICAEVLILALLLIAG